MRPFGSVIIGNSSCCSRMTGLIAVRKRVASISKRVLLSAPSMMSSVTGSTLMSGISAIFTPSTSLLLGSRRVDQQVQVADDLGGVAGQDDGRRVELRHDRGPLDAVPGREPRAVVDPRRQPLALEVDLVLVDDGVRCVVAAAVLRL